GSRQRRARPALSPPVHRAAEPVLPELVVQPVGSPAPPPEGAVGLSQSRRRAGARDRGRRDRVRRQRARRGPPRRSQHGDFTPRVHALRRQRDAVLRRAVEQGTLPGPPPPSAATTGDWKVPPVPEDLRRPGIEISGPCSITSMFINALNPGPEGERAEGDLDDDEDSSGHRLVDTVTAALNRLAAVNRELAFTDAARGRDYRIAPGE